MDNISIKQNIRNIRKSRKLTQEEMAYKMGETSIVNANLIKVASLLETTTEELVLGYRPAQMEGPGLEDMKEEYSGKVHVLERRIADLEKMIHTLEETIATKNEIIAMLKKSLDGEK